MEEKKNKMDTQKKEPNFWSTTRHGPKTAYKEQRKLPIYEYNPETKKIEMSKETKDIFEEIQLASDDGSLLNNIITGIWEKDKNKQQEAIERILIAKKHYTENFGNENDIPKEKWDQIRWANNYIKDINNGKIKINEEQKEENKEQKQFEEDSSEQKHQEERIEKNIKGEK